MSAQRMARRCGAVTVDPSSTQRRSAAGSFACLVLAFNHSLSLTRMSASKQQPRLPLGVAVLQWVHRIDTCGRLRTQ